MRNVFEANARSQGLAGVGGGLCYQPQTNTAEGKSISIAIVMPFLKKYI